MEILLDTNALIFFLQDSPRMKESLYELIEAEEHAPCVSLASLWEISLKHALGKLDADYAARIDLPEFLQDQGINILPLSWATVKRSTSLPRHHKDPFDRILIAESQLRGIPIISADAQLDAYGIERVW